MTLFRIVFVCIGLIGLILLNTGINANLFTVIGNLFIGFWIGFVSMSATENYD